ncbi:lipopolysaccharide assembly protein LapA domain-containing protein [Aliikangiella marina]|uniref:lipopolysaccharide assembly protein LapA domain-containing protein n=1 Tax=Aliikangiella marina TaxID=1712262 RepID=UPI003CCC5410
MIGSAWFFSQNDGPVEINYFSGQVEWRLHWVMIFCFVCGFGIGIASVIGSLLKAKLQLRNIRSKLDRQEKELNSLRSLPIKDDY